MMSTTEILEQLKQLGDEANAKVLMKHGANPPCYGVKIEELKNIH